MLNLLVSQCLKSYLPVKFYQIFKACKVNSNLSGHNYNYIKYNILLIS